MAFPFAALGALAALSGGGGSTEVSTSQSSSVSVVASPVVGISIGEGAVSPSSGGSATGSPVSAATATGAPSSGGLFPASPFLGAGQVNDLDDVQFKSADLFGGLFSDPLMLAALAGVAFLLFSGGK